MFRFFLILAVLCASVSGFASTTPRRASTCISMAAEGMSRSLPFLKKPKNIEGLVGSEDFDPFGFSDYYDVKFMQEAELKHGRVAMLATVGWLVQQAGVHLPSPGGLYDVANPIDAFFHVGASPIAQIVITIGALESINHNGKMSMVDMFKDSNRIPGEMSLPFYGAGSLKGKTPAQIADLKLKELRNGRLAMFAIGGLVHHTIIAGSETFGSFPNTQLWGH